MTKLQYGTNQSSRHPETDGGVQIRPAAEWLDSLDA